MTNDIFKQNLFRLLGKANISNTRLSKLTGIDLVTIRNYLSGKTLPNVKKLMLLCDALGCSPDDLLTDNKYSKYMLGWKKGRIALMNEMQKVIEGDEKL